MDLRSYGAAKMRDEREDELFDAFIAGFKVSSEGFNGEYVDMRYHGESVLEAHLRRWYFSAWREGRGVDYRAMADERRSPEG